MRPPFNIDILAQNEESARFCLQQDGHYLSFEEVFKLWQSNIGFVEFYRDALINIDYQAFYWEHPALHKSFLQKRYECVIQRSKPLEHLPSDPFAFQDYIFIKGQVADFKNLGKDARLIVPTKKTDADIYNHMGKFIRLADKMQLIELFKKVGNAILEEAGTRKPIWLNTAGLGVIWLHVRMDLKPKYYKTKMYKDAEYLSNKN